MTKAHRKAGGRPALPSEPEHREQTGPLTVLAGQDLVPTDDAAAKAQETRRIVEVLKRARDGDEQSLEAARQLFDLAPDLRDRVANLARIAEERWLETISSSQLIRLALTAQLAELRTKLAGPEPTPLEAILVERAVACWLESTYWSHQVAARYADRNGVSATIAAIDMKRQALAEGRFLAAVKTLAQVRRLLSNVPAVAVQVNVGAVGRGGDP